MRCPYCHTENDKVLDTRTDKSGYTVRRKRYCQSCARRFTTSEQIEQLNIRVVKTDSTRVPLDREKIRRGIERACSKRSIGSDLIERTLQAIEADLYDTGESEIATSFIGDVVLQHLAQLDEVAYIRFASVYLEFDGAEDFQEIVARLKREGD